MNPTAQSGMHPDAESLTSFAEQLLPAAERDQILMHMATCRRCREVVFLAQHAASEHQKDQSAPVTSSAPAKQRASWSSGWKWMWIPATAFAGLIGVAVVQHFRHAAPGTQMTAKLSQTDSLNSPEPAKAPATSPKLAIHPTEELQKAQPVRPSAVRDDALPRADKDQMKRLDEKKSIERNELAAGASGTPIGASPGLLGGSVQGAMSAKAKSSPYDGPAAANQLQQQNLAQQNVLQESQDIAADAANKPVMTHAAPGIGVTSRHRTGGEDGVGAKACFGRTTPGTLGPIVQPEIRRAWQSAQDNSAQRAWGSLPGFRGKPQHRARHGWNDVSERRRGQTLAADSHAVDRTCHSRSYPAGRDASRCLAGSADNSV